MAAEHDVATRGGGKELFATPSDTAIAILALAGIGIHLILRFATEASALVENIPLFVVLAIGGVPLLTGLAKKLLALDFGSDLLAGISILSSALLGEYLVGSIVVLMLSGGGALEEHATRRASSVLEALAKRMPSIAHRQIDTKIIDVHIDEIAIGDVLVVFPHEICPVDGLVTLGYSGMDESYLTGEPFHISKAPGSQVLSGAVNGEEALTIQAQKLPVDSRYAKIMEVMHASGKFRPRLRRLGDQLGAWYTPLAVAIAIGAWFASHDPLRFLAVVVVATPCPLLIAIPVAVIGAISLSAKRGIIIKNPAILEQITTCRTIIFDKTGTLTFGMPTLTEVVTSPGSVREDVLRFAASLEQFSKHPLASAIISAAEKEHLPMWPVQHISEKQGEGLRGVVNGKGVLITGRNKVADLHFDLPPVASGLECLIVIDKKFAATLRFHDAPRSDSRPFVRHLQPSHGVDRVMLVSGDRETEVRYLADFVGITEVFAEQSPEQKVEIVRKEVARQKTVFVGDGINDAPALQVATVGVAFGQNSDITAEAADAVVMSASIGKIDELIHIGRRMRTIALQSAVGGMALSIGGMIAASMGYLPALQGAILQELIDLVVVLNAVRAAIPPRDLTDF